MRLPQRIGRYFLLFAAAALLCFAAGVVLILVSNERKRADDICILRLQRACAQIPTEQLRSESPALQALVERWHSQGDLAYCAIVSSDGRILAHSATELVGDVYQEPSGKRTIVDDAVEKLEHANDAGEGLVLEYRAPLRDGDESLATIHMAFPKPDLWASAVPGSLFLALACLGPVVLLAVGTIVLRREVTPLTAIESQLHEAAVAVCPAEVELGPVPATGAAALGWNRLVDAHQRRRQDSKLGERMSAALGAITASRHDSALDSLPDGVALTDEDGRIAFVNRALGAICGISESKSDLAGKSLVELLDLDSRQGDMQAFLTPDLRNRTVATDLRVALKGSPRVLRIARYPYWDSQGHADGSRHVWSVRDVTQQQLAAQTRDQFLQTAAHELRIPLANIKAYAETLSLDESIDPVNQKEFYNVINAEATRLARLIEDLLNVSSMEVGALSASREETDVGRLIQEVVEKVRPIMDQKNVQLETSLPQKWPKAHLDKDKIATSIVNVLGNAAKYTPSGGSVAFRVTVTEGQLSVVVEDTGIGIAAEELPRISEKFFRSADPRVREQTGSGLGLSLVKEVVRLHGGSFDIRSEVDKGTTVTITLPIV